MSHEDERRRDARAFEQDGELFSGGQRGGAMWRCMAGPSKTRAIVAHYGGEFGDAILHQRPADGTCGDSGFEHDGRVASPTNVNMQLAAADIDHTSRWWVSRYHGVV